MRDEKRITGRKRGQKVRRTYRAPSTITPVAIELVVRTPQCSTEGTTQLDDMANNIFLTPLIFLTHSQRNAQEQPTRPVS